MVIQALKNHSQVMLVLFGVGASDENVIDIGIANLHAMQDLVDEALEYLGCILQPNGIHRNSNKPNRFVTAVFRTSADLTGI